MKKFVSSKEINEVFMDMVQVDYVTVQSVTDSTVKLIVHLNISSVDYEKEMIEFNDRAFVLGRMLDRKVELQFKKASKFRSFITRLKFLFGKKA